MTNVSWRTAGGASKRKAPGPELNARTNARQIVTQKAEDHDIPGWVLFGRTEELRTALVFLGVNRTRSRP